MKQYLLIILFSIFSFPYVWGEAIGTWKVYPSYSDVSDIVPTGKEVFVLASNNLYSYNVNDGSLRTYSNNDLLNGCNIRNIAWMNVAKKLIITYSDYTIDLLSLNGNVENISSLAEKQRLVERDEREMRERAQQAQQEQLKAQQQTAQMQLQQQQLELQMKFLLY